ncbi:cytochrome c oxidase accessory protein CcoG [Gracilimonas mengyeensis]|uniref:Cytochrome c oxidase accessory protein FixG n=1 Tax=Gracilimonas mengyeensis TaxID=1302730 RepID=A0A521BDT6_9BACT|nr:cytochrome c oxidase accessory protein CcoG [Gracilimonas mengyeensis]SMO45257.1 cytochrome c oxidase accessory protein FixG [Gracilimonas mengyeensis]
MANLEEERRIDQQSFRDHLSTVNEEGKRNWIYPKKPSGRHYKARNVVAVLLLAFFFSGPFITINGNPLLLLNIIERKFVIFGVAFWPQDLHLLLFGMLTFIIFVVLFTVVFGRLWCGWACPQTIFMEMVFRRVEYWIEGDAAAQIRLNKQDWNLEKITKKVSKHAIFYGMAFLISNLFLAYIIGKNQLFEIITDPPSEHIGGLSAMIVFSGVFYGVFAFMREQVCHFVCPYGRMQSVMLDNNSINVMYDYVRGEERASVKDRFKLENRKATLEDLGFSSDTEFGDCIDCYQCVKVCPMGIDIRNGTQLECIHCTACIDACDSVMDKIDKPRGLIRYSSEEAIREGKQKVLTPRVAGYSGILLILFTTFVTLLTLRPDTETTILREPGTLYQELPDNRYSNIYNIKMLNKTFKEMPVDIRLESPRGEIVSLGSITSIQAQNSAEGRFMVQLADSVLEGSQTALSFGIYSGDEKLETVTSGFLGPATSNQ